ncbi:MAG: MetS family NSS transporter small subunit [Halanaerobiales bacterium]|nr:MetS family NSS transporter small subunit [Halanaerobiales bacterium]
MSLSAIVVLIVACIVLYGGLFVTVSKAAKSAKKKER